MDMAIVSVSNRVEYVADNRRTVYTHWNCGTCKQSTLLIDCMKREQYKKLRLVIVHASWYYVLLYRYTH